MPLKVIGAGFDRTGTLSLCRALNRLGLPCNHLFDILGGEAPRLSYSLDPKKSKTQLDFWQNVANGKAGTQYDWEQVFSEYAAAVGSPAHVVWRELLSAYPGAKVILTVHPRGADAWYESIFDTIYQLETIWQFKVLEHATPYGKKMRDTTRKLIFQRLLKGTISDRSKAIERYHQHIAEVKASVSAEQLLVYSVDQGWKPLCTFLGVPEPSGEFPKVNDRTAMKQWIREYTRAAYAIVAVCALALAGIVYGIARLLW